MSSRRVGGTAAAVQRDLAGLNDESLAESALAHTALVMARLLDNPEVSATAKSMCARVLLDAMTRLRELRPDEEDTDRIDELQEARQKRRAS